MKTFILHVLLSCACVAIVSVSLTEAAAFKNADETAAIKQRAAGWSPGAAVSGEANRRRNFRENVPVPNYTCVDTALRQVRDEIRRCRVLLPKL